METAAKKIRIVKPGDNVMVPVPFLDRAMIDAYSLAAVIVAEYSIDQFKLGTRYMCFYSCLEQKIKNIKQFRPVKHTFLCREGCCRKPSLGTSFPTRRAIF